MHTRASSHTVRILFAVLIPGTLARAQTTWTLQWPQRETVFSAAMAYDIGAARAVAFGGFRAGRLASATMLWDGSSWSTPALSVQPPARFDHAMVYDAGFGEVVRYGGYGNVLLGDTWTWNGSAWRPRQVPGPPPRMSHAMVYDLVRTRTVLFGGLGAAGSLGDTWEWNGSFWRQRTLPQSPPARAGHAMAFDVPRARTVLFGGASTTGLQNDTWEYDGFTWTQATPLTSPPAHQFHAMVFDLQRGVTVLMGGTTSAPFATEFVHTWNGTTWTAVPNPSVVPQPRLDVGAAFDVQNGEVVMLGGETPGAIAFAETWTWKGATWTQRDRDPGQRANAAFVYDPIRDRHLLFGGRRGTAQGLDDTWQWRGGAWTRLFPATSPPARTNHALAFDVARDRAVLFGGGLTAALQDTWEWDGTNWLLLQPAHRPSARYGPAMVYDDVRQRVFLFGGAASATNPFADTWTWDGLDWSQANPAAAPPARWDAALAFDGHRGRAVMFGGTAATGQLADTWEWDGTSWFAPALSTPSPPPLPGARLVHDTARRRSVLFLGNSSTNAAWEWDGTTWRARGGTGTPIGRQDAAASYDSTTNRTLLFGGRNAVSTLSEYRSDMLSYGPAHPATAAPFGTACVSTAGSPLLSALPGELAWLADTMTVAVEPTPPNAPLLLAVGTSRTQFQGQSLPLPLDPIGMPGCALLTSVDLTFATTAVAARGEFQLQVPNDPNLVGLDFYCQAAVADAGANALGVVATNGLACRVGAR